MYLFIPTKYTLLETAAADRATVALEEFTDAIKKNGNKSNATKTNKHK